MVNSEGSKYPVVRPCRRHDASEILSIAAEAGLSEWTQHDYESEFERADSICLLALAEDKHPLGFVVGRVIPGTRNDEICEAEVHNIGVSKVARNRGIGSLLIGEFLARCRDSRIGTVWLEVRSRNQIAIKFYEKHGFVVEFSRKGYYRDPVDDATLMRAIFKP